MGSDAAPLVTKLSWDSDFFKKKIGQLSFPASKPSDPPPALTDFDIIQCKVSSEDSDKINLLNTLNFKFVEGEMDLSLELNLNTLQTQLFPSTERDVDALKSIAQEALLLSRYRSPWYEPSARSALYKTWVEKAHYAQHDDLCLVERRQDSVVGFITLKVLGPKARIGLIAVKPEHQGMGVGRRLLQQAISYSIQNECNELNVATQLSNTVAINAYLKQGFLPEKISYWFYK
ncbi:hypothetical protein PCIT_a1669 [Pseudoalteromonas citrea]|uniref:N-acetyltransferase domain-containing protein n=2 Tax=Pseudoalteromonas citrea TaxID=43655 RepID=A0AAD4AMK5_9GAMM|nr:dTDP-4-amino-4,6-dideoxy-D-galactose acyltransferase [Pseudoalteromonas citrea]KAF7775471.1 hypothetical protein PCIT_a1669 [Pseudoalteromonas citrea]